MPSDAPVIEITGLRTCFNTQEGPLCALEGVSLHVSPGEALGVVGESGCGKSVLALSILRLLPMPPAFFDGGLILFEGADLMSASRADIRKIRGNRISMIFQEPMTALNPVFTIGNQLSEVFRVHRNLSRGQAMEESEQLLGKVGVPAPKDRLKAYPFELSGGLRQRVMIAMAMACRPRLLIADEPTTALDVTIQAQILELMEALRRELGMAILLISHDLGVIAEMADRVMVMYTGAVVESARTLDLFDRPLHPYTRGLMRAIPGPDSDPEGSELFEIQGMVPSLSNLPDGCRFHPRCPHADGQCRSAAPRLEEREPDHWVACWKAGETGPEGIRP